MARFIRYAWEDWLVGRLLCFYFSFPKILLSGSALAFSTYSSAFRFSDSHKKITPSLLAVWFVLLITQKVSDYFVVCSKPFRYCALVYKSSIFTNRHCSRYNEKGHTMCLNPYGACKSFPYYITWIILNYTRDIGITKRFITRLSKLLTRMETETLFAQRICGTRQ